MRCTGEPWLLLGMSPEHVVVHGNVAGSAAAVGGRGAVVSWDLRSWGHESPAMQVFLAR